MPVTKNAALRYRLIDECLQRRQRTWTAALLLDTVAGKFFQATGLSLSKRQLAQDLADMREGGTAGLNAPIAWHRDQGYHYTDAGFSIHNSPLLTDDAAVLRQALAALRQLQGLGLSEELDEVVRRVEGHLHQQPAAGAEAAPHILFEQVPDYAGVAWLAPLYRAVRAQQVLRLRYRAFGVAEGWEETVQPYLLKQFNHRWFLVGQGSGRPGISNYALDRIEAADPDPATPYVTPPASLAARFQDVVGVSVPAGAGPPELVRLRFRPERGQYVQTKPLHPSQENGPADASGLEISLRVQLNRELETLVLSFGDDVEVLAPAALRQQVAGRLRQGAAQYCP